MKNSHDAVLGSRPGIFGRLAQQLPLVLCVCLNLLAPFAEATTEAENTMKNAPMPHELLGTGGTTVKLHFARLDGYVEGRPDNTARLVQLKALVQTCLSRKSGSPVNPPRAWPDFIDNHRSDTYSSVNRSIRYSSGITYAVNQVDCSLFEGRRFTARLSSSIGNCDIDLLKKTANGVCDAQAHANARPRLRAPASTLTDVEAALRKAPNNPGLAALADAMRQNPPGGAGERKTILGLECDVVKNAFDPGGTVCLSRGGSFVASDVNGEVTQSSMTLETTSVSGIKMHTVAAKLDTMVDGAVFAPYLAGGFTVTNLGPRK